MFEVCCTCYTELKYYLHRNWLKRTLNMQYSYKEETNRSVKDNKTRKNELKLETFY